MDEDPTRTYIVWFRRDLRVEDNAALERAAAGRGRVVPVYLIDWESGDRWAPGTASRWWLTRSLAKLGEALAAWGAPLTMLAGEPVETLSSLARRLEAGAVVCNRLYEPFSRELDERVERALKEEGVAFRAMPGALLHEPSEHLSRSGRPFVQFGAFWRSIGSASASVAPGGVLPALPSSPAVSEASSEGLVEGDIGGSPPPVDWSPEVRSPGLAWEPGERGAHKRLDRFLQDALAAYSTGRDIPAIEGVSRLSPHLHFGEITPARIWSAVAEVSGAPGGPAAAGAGAFLRQLGWREFAHHLLYHFPRTPLEPFRPEFGRFPWTEDREAVRSWRQGRTGYELVDAGMRQLAEEGWMHNRVRMVVASFLTKDLLIPWQDGAEWFWDHLVDADLANNTLGWQWTAGSGPDAAPYFRVYNPAVQAERFDPEREYVRRWFSESADNRGPREAVEPIVDHGAARLRALAAYRSIRRGGVGRA